MDINPIEVQTHLKGIDYPASKDEALQQLEGPEFEGPDDVMGALG